MSKKLSCFGCCPGFYEVDVMKEGSSVRGAGKRILAVVYNSSEDDGVCGVAI